MTLQRPLQALALCACLVLTAVCTNAAETTQTIKPDGRTDLTLTRPGMKSVHVALWPTKIENTFPYKDALLWGADVGALPQQVVSSIEVYDGDTSYDAKLGFEGGCLVRRTVALREFRLQRREETSYSFPKRTGK